MICLTAYQLIMGYLMPKFDYSGNVWLQSFQLNYLYSSITLACDVFKVEYMIADFKAVFYAESKNPTNSF